MRTFLNLSTRAKLLAGFGLMALFAAAAIVFAYQALQVMRESQRNLLDVEMGNVVDLKSMRADHQAIRATVALMMVTPDASRLEALRAEMNGRDLHVQAQIARIMGRGGSIDQKSELLREFEATQTASRELRETRILPLLASERIDEARTLFTGVQLERDRRMAALADELIEHSSRSAAQSVAAAEREAAATMRNLLAIALLALLTGVGLALLFTRVLAQPLRLLSQATERLAAGDLSVELPVDDRKDETGVLTRSFARMVQRLREMMRELGEGITVLATSASQISASTAQVSAGSAQTASAVAETSATAEEVKQTAKVAADKAAQVQDAAQRTMEASQSGLQAMNQSIEAMHQIRAEMDAMAQGILRLADQGAAIGEIVATVNDLADQSKLLSVNASIEAARAGDEGAGFRVVAQEIRSLAEQSKQATVQVKALLSEIQKATSSAVLNTEQVGKAVRSGVDLSEATGRSIRAMAGIVQESAQAAAQIAASAQQQAVGMDQVAYAMQNINQASSQNLAASRQTEAAAQGLQNLGQRLKSLVEQYRH